MRDPGLKASTYAEKQAWKVDAVDVKDRVNEIVLDDGVSIGMRDMLHETFELVGRDVHYNSHKKKFVIRNKEIDDGSK